jgi:hypothetical protein
VMREIYINLFIFWVYFRVFKEFYFLDLYFKVFISISFEILLLNKITIIYRKLNMEYLKINLHKNILKYKYLLINKDNK